MKEEEIRPDVLFSEYLSLTEKDGKTYFCNTPLYRIPCPACKNEEGDFLFRKGEFDFEECPKCGLLYVNPRPTEENFTEFYETAPSIKYWATHFYKHTEDSRRKLLIRPKAVRVKEIIHQFAPALTKNDCILDIGAGYGVFCEELQALFQNIPEIIAVEPSQELQEVCKNKKIQTIGKFFERVTKSDIGKKRIIAATSFELLEHLANPDRFINHCYSVLPKGALLILTTLNWRGFDLQVLRHKSRNIQPPTHINFFTPTSIEILLKRHSFDIVEITTPGKLDVDIVSKQVSDINGDFLSQLIIESDDNVKQKFQKFLQEANLSSHMMVVAKRK